MRFPWLALGVASGLWLLVLLPKVAAIAIGLCPLGPGIVFVVDRFVAAWKRPEKDPARNKAHWNVAPCLAIGAVSGIWIAPPSSDAPQFIVGSAAIGLVIGLVLDMLETRRARRTIGCARPTHLRKNAGNRSDTLDYG